MSFQLNVPPSVVARLTKSVENEDENEVSKGKKREDFKKLKELEEARKAGTAPAMKDEEGKDINPHIPQYIMQAPWYYGAMQPTLKHQRQQSEKQKVFSKLDDWYQKGLPQGPIATKYRKGACENCGAITHKKKDCLERPRKIGAKFTGEDIAPDEPIQKQLDFDYDGKRDRWNGYDSNDHQKVIEDYQKLEEAKRILKAQKLEEALLNGEINEEEARAKLEGKDDEIDEDDKYADEVAMPGQKVDSKERVTVRNLRIREDTAKYLFNLDVNSAHYDPKTRSMRDNPFANTGKDPSQLPYAGDNFVRYSGDAMNMAKQQLFAWEAYEKGTEVHLQADPTKLAILNKEFKDRKDKFKTSAKQSILEKYGGAEHLDTIPKELLLAQTEEYIEYSRHGTIIKGQEKAHVKSRYEEDVYINNHKSVWGSFWASGRWGYRCCHSHVKESYCTGEAGIQAEQSIRNEMSLTSATAPASSKEDQSEKAPNKTRDKRKRKKKEKKRKNRKKRAESSESSTSSSDTDESDREEKIRKAMREELERQKKLKFSDGEQGYNVMYDNKKLTEEQIEAYHRLKQLPDDPMAQFLG